MERFLENAMYASRWLLAPVYFGLSLGLIALTIKFFQEIFHILPHIFSVSESDMILTLLSLVDMTLVGGLLVMVMFSGYENFVSQLDINEGKEKLSWLGKMDATSLKNKVAASIVADLLYSPAAGVYGCEKRPGQQADVVRDYPPDLRAFGLCDGLP